MIAVHKKYIGLRAFNSCSKHKETLAWNKYIGRTTKFHAYQGFVCTHNITTNFTPLGDKCFLPLRSFIFIANIITSALIFVWSVYMRASDVCIYLCVSGCKFKKIYLRTTTHFFWGCSSFVSVSIYWCGSFSDKTLIGFSLYFTNLNENTRVPW